MKCKCVTAQWGKFQARPIAALGRHSFCSYSIATNYTNTLHISISEEFERQWRCCGWGQTSDYISSLLSKGKMSVRFEIELICVGTLDRPPPLNYVSITLLYRLNSSHLHVQIAGGHMCARALHVSLLFDVSSQIYGPGSASH